MSKLDLQDIKSRIRISEFARDKLNCIVTKNKTMCCHIHHEKTPSLNFNDEKCFYYCYGCHKSGDVFSLTQEIKNFSFLEAVKFVAESIGIKIEDNYGDLRNSSQLKEKKEILYEMMEDICQYFQKELYKNDDKSRVIFDYLKNRSLSDEIIKKFKLGYSAENIDDLIKHLIKKYENNINLLYDSGLFKKGFRGQNKFYNILQDRIIFPIFDKFGRVIAFGGRIRDGAVSQDGKRVPKYINCGDSMIFKKNETLYGEHLARQYMNEKSEAIIVEGYFDVIAMHDAGIKNVIAPLGTAVGEFQLNHLWSIVDNINCAFDGDLAGQKASFGTLERALPIIKAGKFLKFSYMPNDLDPADLIKRNDINELNNILENSISLAENLYQYIYKKYKGRNDPDSIAGMKKNLIQYLKMIQDLLIQREYRGYFKEKFDSYKESYSVSNESFNQNIFLKGLYDQESRSEFSKKYNSQSKMQYDNKKWKKDENKFNTISTHEQIFCYIVVLMFLFPKNYQEFINENILKEIYSKSLYRQELKNLLKFSEEYCFNQNLDDLKQTFPRFIEGISNSQQDIARYKVEQDEYQAQKNLFLKFVQYNLEIFNLKERKENLQKNNDFLGLIEVDLEEKKLKRLLDGLF